MEALVGIMILMGIMKLPRFRMHWKEDIIRVIMSRTRGFFFQIWHYFHVADNSVAVPVGALLSQRISERHFIEHQQGV